MRKPLGVTFVGCALGAVAFGCGESTAPSEPGVLQAVVRDDPTTRIAALPGNGFRLAHHKESGSKYYHGSLIAEMQVLVSADGASWTALGAARAATVALQDEEAETPIHEAGAVPSGTYRYVRLVLGDASASLTAGSTLGETELQSDTPLHVGDGSGAIMVDRELPAPLDLGPGQTVILVFDLNSEAWVSGDAASVGRADPAGLEAAVSVGVRLPPAEMSFAL